ncbi:MAG: trypsin-like peptidase domain-containing protein [Methylacidiphilales bacterium]|nr:trypsin-like peptidase domain-containing protein [Candidatus Methylacidiphilales bacterium]
MIRISILVVSLLVLTSAGARAVEYVPTSSYNEAVPTSSDITNWDSGWAQPPTEPTGYTYTTGWNYIGRINGASGTYVGYGWVLTAAHLNVTGGTFTLGGTNYTVLSDTVQEVGNTDLTLFQITPVPPLPALPLRSSDPVADKSLVAMIGFGDGGDRLNETWGYNTVNLINQSITPGGYSYVSNDFLTLTGTTNGITNNYQVVFGDSGGGDFIYNSSTHVWELAGINEVEGTATINGTDYNISGFVQIDTYASQILRIITPNDTPTIPVWGLAAFALLLLFIAARSLPRTTPADRIGPVSQ